MNYYQQRVDIRSKSYWMRSVVILVLGVILLACNRQAYASTIRELPQTRITVNGSALALDPQNPAIEMNSRILVPMRIILEALGASIGWDDTTQTVTANVPGIEVVLRIGNNMATINGELKFLDVLPMLYNMRTYVPVRFVSEASGASVDYDPATGNVAIFKAGGAAVTPPLTTLPTSPPPSLPSGIRNLNITTAFTNGGVIPARYQASDVAGALEMSPRVSWNAFSGAQSYALAFFDVTPDMDGYLHWLIVLPGNTTSLAENASLNETYPDEAEEITAYIPPDLEPEDNRHDFELRVVALSIAVEETEFHVISDLGDFISAVSPYALAQGIVSGYINYGKEITPAPVRPGSLSVQSTAMGSAGIPLKYTDSYTETAEGDGISIPLSWSRGPGGTLTYAFILVDTTPGMDNYIHWLVADIPPGITSISENASELDRLPEESEEIIYYEPPMLDEEDGRHTYKLIVVALNDDLEGIEDLEMVYTLEEFEAAIAGHVMARGELNSFFQVR
ncbi:MAG: stalk domain-containing protein [Symbiobacteriaceae bacterium]|nr:stalk domain-containing protein [Symbiobacteriaceae bacterium]